MDQARFADIYKGIKEHGLDYSRASFKHLRGKRWEIKFAAQGGRYRICYVLIEKDKMVWLHAFKKTTQKTPVDDLEIAQRRMKEVL